MKKLFSFLAVIVLIASFLVPEVTMAQYSTGGQTTTQKTTKDKNSGGGSGGYSITGLPTGCYSTLRRPFNVEFGVQLSNGTSKHYFTGVVDIGINFKGKQFLGARLMYHPINFVAVGFSEYVTYGQDMAVGYSIPTGEFFGFADMTKNTFNLEVELSLTIPLKQDLPYRHKFSLRLVPFGVFHNRYGKGDMGIPLQNYDIGFGYNWAIPVGSKKKK